MNLVGKIFIVFVFVMAVAFAAIASSIYITRQPWMATAIEKSDQLKKAQAQKKAAEEKNAALNQQLKDERDRQARDLTKLECENIEFRKERVKNETAIAEKQAELRKSVEGMNTLHQQLTTLRSRVTTLAEEIKTARTNRDAKMKELLRLKDEINTTVDELTRLQKRAEELTQDLLKARSALGQ
jgi:chromosome segregation ATPase